MGWEGGGGDGEKRREKKSKFIVFKEFICELSCKKFLELISIKLIIANEENESYSICLQQILHFLS